mmetsp:Transcript_18829/g.34077  ORF Transcript_18829/g.34077 Transcript_18829/m.34077 type:complete len:245 (+) Transcript_18829:410-1144(+)
MCIIASPLRLNKGSCNFLAISHIPHQLCSNSVASKNCLNVKNIRQSNCGCVKGQVSSNDRLHNNDAIKIINIGHSAEVSPNNALDFHGTVAIHIQCFFSPPTTKYSLDSGCSKVIDFKAISCPPTTIASLYFNCRKIKDIIVIVFKHDTFRPLGWCSTGRNGMVLLFIMEYPIRTLIIMKYLTRIKVWVSLMRHPIANCSLYHVDSIHPLLDSNLGKESTNCSLYHHRSNIMNEPKVRICFNRI